MYAAIRWGSYRRVARAAMIAQVSSRLLVAAAFLAYPAHGHFMVQEPPSRSFDHSRYAGRNGNEFEEIDTVPYAYAAGGIKVIQERARATPQDVLDEYGGGAVRIFPLYHSPFATNGNYLEPNSIAVRHSICGGPRLGAPDDLQPYSTDSNKFDVLRSYVSGGSITIDTIIVIHHGGHLEVSVCDTSDSSLNPGGVPTQECFNKYPLDRDPSDDSSPIDPNYSGRYYVQPRCQAQATVEQDHVDNLEMPGFRMLMKYKLPEGLTCTHCVVQIHYLTGHVCPHIGYAEYEPESWPGSCAQKKSDWVKEDTIVDDVCGTAIHAYPEEFWQCSDIEIVSGGGAPMPAAPKEEKEEDAPEYDFIYRGCVEDERANRIMKRVKLPGELESKMTGELCMDICDGYKYSGTQYGKECWCGGADTDHLQHGESDRCDEPCAGDAAETCGGWYCMEVREFV
eukprot:g7896.t1